MAIFGSASPMIIYHVSGSTAPIELVLNNSVTSYSWDKTIDATEAKDIFNGDIVNEFNTSYSEFEVTINLTKIDDYQTRIALYNQLYSILHTNVDEFYPHSDGISVKDNNGIPVKYFVSTLTNKLPVPDMNTYDQVVIKFLPVNGSESGYSVTVMPDEPPVEETTTLKFWDFENLANQGWI